MHESHALPTCPVIGRNEERILAPSVDESAQELTPEVSAASVELRTQHLILGRESVSAGRRGMGQELRLHWIASKRVTLAHRASNRMADLALA